MTAIALVLAAAVGGLVVWLIARGKSPSARPVGPTEAGHRDQVRDELATKLEQHRQEAEAQKAAAAAAAQEEQHASIDDWMADRYGDGRRAPGAGDD